MGCKDSETRFVWECPQVRGIIPLRRFHISTRMQRTIRRGHFKVTCNVDFLGVISGCACREVTWINTGLISLYAALHKMGRVQSIEVWEHEFLVGGLYGVSNGKAFHGESMFSRKTDASKIALAFLVSHLIATGFVLLDVQWNTKHLSTMGAISVYKGHYMALLQVALAGEADFSGQEFPRSGSEVLQRINQTS